MSGQFWENDRPAGASSLSDGGGTVIIPDTRSQRQDSREAASDTRDDIRTNIAVGSDARSAAGQNFDQTRALRNDFASSAPVANYRTVVSQYATALNSTPDAAGDLNLIYAFAKVMDPGSVVRESEMDMAQGTSNRLSSLAQRFNFEVGDGGRLTPESRNRLLREMHNRTVVANQAYNQARSTASADAQALGVEPERVVGAHPGLPYRDQIQTFLSRNPEASSIPIPRGPDGRPGLRPDDPTGPVGLVVGFAGEDAPTSPRLTNAQAQAYAQFQLQNRGRLTGDMLDAWVRQNGLPGLGNANEIADYVNRTGEAVTQFDYGPADEQRNASLQAEIAQRDALNGGEPGQAGNIRRLAENGFTWNLGDEASGLAVGALEALQGNDPLAGYTRERDIQRLQDQRARDQLGGFGTAAEIGGALLSGRAPVAGAAPMATGQLIREGAVIGAGSGFGAGEGMQDSIRNAAIGGGAGAGLGALVGRFINGPSRIAPERQAFLDAASRNPEVPIIPADITGNTGTQLGTALAESSTFGGFVSNARDRGAAAMGNLAEDVASRVGTVGDNVAAGDAAVAGANRYVADSQSRVGRAYAAIPIAGDVNAELTSTRSAFSDLSRRYSSNPELQASMRDSRLTRWQQAIEQGNLSWDDLKAFRTDIGEMIEGPVLTEAGSRSRLRQLYGALTADMEATARAQGPQALTAFKAANRAAAERFSNIERVITPVLGNDAQRGAEAAFSRIESWAKAKGGDHVRLARFMRSIPADDANTIRATIISRLGEATPGANNVAGDVFSPATFMTNWNRLSERARSVLFDGPHRQAIDDLAALSNGMEQGTRFRNTSQTARPGVIAATVTHWLSDPIGGTANLAGQASFAGLLSSPRVARWLVALSRKPNVAAANAHVGRLTSLAAAEPTISRDILGLQQALRQRFGEIANPSRAAASPDSEQDVNNAR